jgi:predicted dehydrogenase
MIRIAILGCGSIGTRHIGNLLSLGISDLLVFDPDLEKRDRVEACFGVQSCPDLNTVWESEPDAVLITTPPNLHLELAKSAAEHGCHYFVEKPLAVRMEGLDELIEMSKARELITMVGCNMRFHFGPSTIKRLISEGAIGRIISASLDAGQYMPDWHPDQDYRRRYSAQSAMGGGVILDGIHELDYARWLFGEVIEVFCHGGKLSNLEIDVEDSANILMLFETGFSAMVHIDYVQRSYSRTCKVIGEEGTVAWDINGTLECYSSRTGQWEVWEPPKDYTINDMYVEELRHFLSCLDQHKPTVCDVEDAAKVTRLALAARESMERGKKVLL